MIPTYVSGERSIHIATKLRGVTPPSTRARARRFARPFSSAYVICAAPNFTATASGVRSTCCSNRR